MKICVRMEMRQGSKGSHGFIKTSNPTTYDSTQQQILLLLLLLLLRIQDYYIQQDSSVTMIHTDNCLHGLWASECALPLSLPLPLRVVFNLQPARQLMHPCHAEACPSARCRSGYRPDSAANELMRMRMRFRVSTVPTVFLYFLTPPHNLESGST
jgi:hypothetical protein